MVDTNGAHDTGSVTTSNDPSSGPASLRSLLDHLPGLAYRARGHDRAVPDFVSEGCLALTGYAASDFTSGAVHLTDLLHPDDAPHRHATLATGLRTGDPFTVTFRIRTRDGATRWVREQGCTHPLPNGRGTLIEGMLVDVTDAEESRARLLDDRRQFAEAQRIARVGSWMFDGRAGLTTASEEIRSILGVEPEEELDLLAHFWSLLSPLERARSHEIMATNRRPMTQGEWTLTRRDGSVRHVFNRTEWTFDGDGNVVFARGTMQDITDRVEAETRLAESESRFRSLVEASAQIVWRIGFDGMPLDGMQSFRDFTGLTPRPGRLARESWLDVIHPDERRDIAEQLEHAYRERVPFMTRHRLRRADGEWRVVEARGVPVKDPDGRIREWVGTMTDVTDSTRAERSAQLVQAQQVALLQSIPEAAWLKDLNRRYVIVNSAYIRSVGLTDVADVIGKRASDLFPEIAARRFEAEEQSVLHAGHPMTFVSHVPADNGRVNVFETTIAPYVDAEGNHAGTVGVARDITERRQLQERLERSQKMEALGLLSGGIAHDFNNLLTAIIGGTDLARMEIREDTRAAQDLDEVRRAAVRGAQLTRQLLAFSRHQVTQVRPVDLSAVVRDTEALLRRLVGDMIVLDIETEPLCVVRGDAGQFEQTIVNLVVNARDAVADADRDGVITVETARIRLERGDERLERREAEPLPAGEYVTLSVHDNGTGMSEATIARIFDPFFTTKRVGEGTGLGLATVSGIVGQRDGTVHVTSTLGTGTAFTVVLPYTNELPERIVATTAASPTGTETLLLVEDEAVVRTTARRILERHGYTVLEARHGNDALRIWEQDAARIGLVITDLRMPELGGRDFVRRIHRDRPDMPTVFMSGYAHEEEMPDADALRRCVFLPKPFTSETLLVCVREALDA